MVAPRRISGVDGFVHDIDTINGLSADLCNMIFLSDRSLYVLQNLANKEVGFYTRYGTIMDGGLYEPVTNDDSNELLLIDTINQIRGELSMDCLTDLVSAINQLTGAVRESATASSCCGNTGDAPNIGGVDGGTPPVGFEEPAAITDRRCKAANYVWETVDGILEKLEESPVEEFALLGVRTMTGLVTGLIVLAVTGPVFISLIILAAGAIVTLAVALTVAGVDIAATRVKWGSNAGDIVNALYQSFDTDEARSNVLQVLEDDGLSLVNRGIVAACLPDMALNLLWFETSESETEIDDQAITYTCTAECFEFYELSFAEGGGGPVVDLGGGLFSLTGAEDGSGKWRAGVRFNWVPFDTDCCGAEKTIAYSSGDSSGFDGILGVRVWEDDDPPGCPDSNQIYGQSTTWGGTLDARFMVLRSDNPFETVFSWV